MKKSKKITITIISVILGLIILLTGTGVGVYQFYVKPKIQSIVQSENSDFNVNDILEDVEKTLEEDEVRDYINEEDPNKTEELQENIEEAKERNEKKSEKKNEAASGDNTKSKYEKAKEQIAPADLKDGMALAAKVDPGYILGLLSGGLTSEEKSELKQYLKARLSSGEISRGIQLFSKYSYLL